MFRYNSAFNQDISAWDVSSGLNFKKMFLDATSFNQDLTEWYFKIDDLDNAMFWEMFENTSCPSTDGPSSDPTTSDVVEGEINFCHARTVILPANEDKFLEEARIASELAATSYYQADIDWSYVDVVADGTLVDYYFRDFGSDVEFGTYVLGGREGQVFLVFRGTDIPSDPWELAEMDSSDEIDMIETEASTLFSNTADGACYTHEALYNHHSNLEQYIYHVWEFMTLCQQGAYGGDDCSYDSLCDCEPIIAGHSAGAANAMYAAAYFNEQGQANRVYTFGALPVFTGDGCESNFELSTIYNFYGEGKDGFGQTIRDPVPWYPFDNEYWHIGNMIEIVDGDSSNMLLYYDNTDLEDKNWGSNLSDGTMAFFDEVLYYDLLFGYKEQYYQALLHMASTYSDWFGSASSGYTLEYNT